MGNILRIEASGASLELDTAVGNIPYLRFTHGGRVLTPLHVAGWRDDAEVQADANIPMVEKRLAGDFFCAPFGASTEQGVPPHGWPANSEWSVERCTGGEAQLRLLRGVKGATIEKHVKLADDAPLLYQEHIITGGNDILSVAHHPIVHLAGKAKFCASPKRMARTPATPLEPGRARLAYPAQAQDLKKFPAHDGGIIDLTLLPIAKAHEDFVVLIEERGHAIGWIAIVREAENDIVFFLKDPEVLPFTLTWHSNAGRDYSPWNGQHTGVIGIEDGCVPVELENLSDGLKLSPGVTHRVAHVTGAVVRPEGWSTVTDIKAIGSELWLENDKGQSISLPWRADFLKGHA